MAWACVECEKGAATVFFILTESLSVKCLCIIFYMSFSLSSLMFSLICRFLPKDKNYPYLTLRSIWCDTAVIQDVWHLYKDKGMKCFHDGMTMTMRRKKNKSTSRDNDTCMMIKMFSKLSPHSAMTKLQMEITMNIESWNIPKYSLNRWLFHRVHHFEQQSRDNSYKIFDFYTQRW